MSKFYRLNRRFLLSFPWFFLGLLTAGNVFAQVLQGIPSPTAANLGLYGEIPVSYYTGTPDICIPIYEIKGKQVNVPF